MKTYYLYIKTHNKTGLKYLGQTTQDPFIYNGSGKYWLNHLNKHGYNINTEIVGTYNTIEELREKSIELSLLYDITNNKDWANLVMEEGSGGDTSKFIDYTKIVKPKNKKYEEIYGNEQAAIEKEKRRQANLTHRKNKSWEEIYGIERAAVMRENMRIRMKLRYKKDLINEQL